MYQFFTFLGEISFIISTYKRKFEYHVFNLDKHLNISKCCLFVIIIWHLSTL